MIRFGAVAGRAELRADGRKAGEKADFAEAAFRAAVPAGAHVRTIALLVEAANDAPSGIVGPVMLAPHGP